MKNHLFCATFLFAFLSVVIGAAEEPLCVTPEMSAWSRVKDGITVTTENDGGQTVGKVVHTGNLDWAIAYPKPVNVTPGEIWSISCRMKLDGNGYASTGVTLYSDGKPTSWIFGGRGMGKAAEWVELKNEFIVPPGTTTMLPRLTGGEKATVWFADYTLCKKGTIPFLDSQETFALENDTLSLTVRAKDGAFSVKDKRTGRTWEPVASGRNLFVQKAQKTDSGVCIEFLDASTMTTWRGTVALEKDAPEMVAKLEPLEKEARMEGPVAWPNRLATVKGDRLIFPLNEGFSIPAEGPNPCSGRLYTYGGHGLCMAFAGVVDEKSDAKSAYFMISETPDDGGFEIASNNSGNETNGQTLYSIGPYWVGQKNLCGYGRTVRYCFLLEGGHVAICKRYRQYAKQTGLYLSFAEKVEKNPRLADGMNRLRGAANIWCWDGDKIGVVKMLQNAGIDRILWSGGGSEADIKAMNEMPNVLTSRYDIYQDIMDPSRFPELPGVHGGWISEAWPNDIILLENGDWQKGWAVKPKDPTKPMIPCGVLCDSQALPYAEKRIAAELASIPYKARFLDTTVAAPWQQCWNPRHPMTRSESRVWKMKLLALMGERFDLVCGSETGHEASVPYCDFYEGMMSLGPFRVPDSGRDMARIWDEVPERVGKYQVGEEFRLPLWELVYHDCVVSYWYWGDYNNKLPKIWKKRDLFNALYGVPPMYMFGRVQFEKDRDRFVESWKVAGPVSQKTGWSEMIDHQILTDDRTVQKTVFSDGTVVVVNFGDKPFTLENGETLGPESFWKNF